MNFLDAAGSVGRRADADAAEACKFSSRGSGKADYFHALFLGCLGRFQDVGGIAAGGNRNQDVAAAAEGLDLAGKNFFKTVVVGNCGEKRSVGGQGNCWKWFSVFFEAAGEFGCEVLAVGSGAAVAAQEDFAAFFQGRRNECGGVCSRRCAGTTGFCQD